MRNCLMAASPQEKCTFFQDCRSSHILCESQSIHQNLGQSEVERCLCGWPMWIFAMSPGTSMELYPNTCPTTWDALELEWPFRVILSWAEITGSLYSCIYQSSSGRVMTLGKGTLQLRQPLKGLTSESSLPTKLPAAEATSSSLKENHNSSSVSIAVVKPCSSLWLLFISK